MRRLIGRGFKSAAVLTQDWNSLGSGGLKLKYVVLFRFLIASFVAIFSTFQHFLAVDVEEDVTPGPYLNPSFLCSRNHS